MTPQVSPGFCAARVKGRLQHSLRKTGAPVVFSRKPAVRSLWENTRLDLEGYIRGEVRKEGFADPRLATRMSSYTIARP